MPISSRIFGSFERNHTLVVKGILDDDIVEPYPIVEWKGDRLPKIRGMLWILQEKMGIHLWWNYKTQDNFITMESRNFVRFDYPFEPPEGWDKVLYMTAYGVKSNEYMPKHFWFLLDIDK